MTLAAMVGLGSIGHDDCLVVEYIVGSSYDL